MFSISPTDTAAHVPRSHSAAFCGSGDGSDPAMSLSPKSTGATGMFSVSNIRLGRSFVFVFVLLGFEYEAMCTRTKFFHLNCFCVCPVHYTSSEERGLSRKHIIESIRGSLERLQLDYIDIVLIHRADPMCPMEGWIIALSNRYNLVVVA